MEQISLYKGSLFDFFFEDGAFSKQGHHSQGIYVDPKGDFAQFPQFSLAQVSTRMPAIGGKRGLFL